MEILHILEKDAVKSVVIQAMIKEKVKDYFNNYFGALSTTTTV